MHACTACRNGEDKVFHERPPLSATPGSMHASRHMLETCMHERLQVVQGLLSRPGVVLTHEDPERNVGRVPCFVDRARVERVNQRLERRLDRFERSSKTLFVFLFTQECQPQKSTLIRLQIFVGQNLASSLIGLFLFHVHLFRLLLSVRTDAFPASLVFIIVERLRVKERKIAQKEERKKRREPRRTRRGGTKQHRPGGDTTRQADTSGTDEKPLLRRSHAGKEVYEHTD